VYLVAAAAATQPTRSSAAKASDAPPEAIAAVAETWERSIEHRGTNKLGDQCKAEDPNRDAEPIASHGPFIPMALCERQTDSTSQQLGVGGVAFVGVGWEQEEEVGSSDDRSNPMHRRWTRDGLETTLPRDQYFTC
jgi:hypothetical protein